MSTNGYTRDAIIERAGDLASRIGLAGLTIGTVARELTLPKSTVYSHVRSRQRLQLDVMEGAARELVREVVRPALRAPDGLPRLERLFGRWLEWDGRVGYPGGCLFVATASEFDDRPGPVRERLVRLCRLWRHLVGSLVAAAVTGESFRSDLDREQFLHDLHGIMLAYHHAARLLHDPDAERLAKAAFAALVAGARR